MDFSSRNCISSYQVATLQKPVMKIVDISKTSFLFDNKTLTYLKESNFKSTRVARWAMRLQDWAFQVRSFKGVENHVADCLSRT